MTSSIATIHIAKKQLGLDDDTYRDKLVAITGKNSTKDMSEAERRKVVDAMTRDGFKSIERRPAGKPKLAGKFAKKLQALWIGAYNLGIVKNRTDDALIAFVKRQTGIEHTRWLIYAEDARKAVEALKQWIGRESGVMFGNLNGFDWLAEDGAKIAWAQWRVLHPDASLIVRKGFDAAVFAIVPRTWLGDLKPADWRTVMNHFGPKVRALKKKTAK